MDILWREILILLHHFVREHRRQAPVLFSIWHVVLQQLKQRCRMGIICYKTYYLNIGMISSYFTSTTSDSLEIVSRFYAVSMSETYVRLPTQFLHKTSYTLFILLFVHLTRSIQTYQGRSRDVKGPFDDRGSKIYHILYELVHTPSSVPGPEHVLGAALIYVDRSIFDYILL